MSYKFWLLIAAFFLAQGFFAFICYSYKNIADINELDDEIMTYAGSTGELLNSLSKLMWGYLADRYGPLKTFMFNLALGLINCFCTQFTLSSNGLFAFIIVFSYI